MSDDAHAAAELRRRVEEAVGGIFEVEDEIGRGGMAVVYRALDRRLRRHLALKVLPPDLAFRRDVRSRFVREAQLAAQLSHPNIVPIYAVDETGDVVWFAMGLVEGEPLAQRLAREPRPPVAFVRRLLREVAAGLAYAHEHGVVHRDVKPDNVLVDRASGRAVVTDFGIARATEGDLRLTATGVAVGTPAYMSPEQAMGEKDVDGRADIYALGVVGWQMLAGELPFHSENTPGMLMKHISEPPRPLGDLRPDLPANFVYAIERAMAKSRNDRWPDAVAFCDALAEDAPDPPQEFSNARTPVDTPRARLGDDDDGPGLPVHSGPPSPMKPWRFDPSRDPALQSSSGERALREWREQRQAWRERYRAAPIDHEPLSRREAKRAARREERWEKIADRFIDRSPEARIRRAQRSLVSFVMWGACLATINMVTNPRFPWFIFPVLAMGVGLASRISALWVDGIPLSRLFRRQPYVDRSGDRDRESDGDEAAEPAPRLRGGRGASGGGRGTKRAAPRLRAPDLSGVPDEVLAGVHGATIREAAEAKVVIADVVSRLTPEESLSLPDVNATAAALEERVRALAGAMHQLDRDASPAALSRLEQRLAEARAGAIAGSEGERRVGLLERQHATLKDLASRREVVAQQFDSAALLLQTMKLDMLKLNSTGVETRIADSTLATQEARAVAADIERLVDAANEVRKL